MVVVTGLSGAGRSVAAGALEDLGWFVIDNLPADLVPKVGELAFEVGLSTQALAQPVFGVLGRRSAPRERRLGAQKGACWTSVVGARESPFPTLFCPLALSLSLTRSSVVSRPR